MLADGHMYGPGRARTHTHTHTDSIVILEKEVDSWVSWTRSIGMIREVVIVHLKQVNQISVK